MKFWWLLVILALILLGSRFREGFDTAEITDAKCPDGSSPPITDFKCVGTDNPPTCPSGTTLYMVMNREEPPTLKCVANTRIYDGAWTDGERTRNPCRSPTHSVGIFVPPTGPTSQDSPKCIDTSSSSVGTTAGGTTGGSSTTSAAPTTRRTGARGVFGPGSGGFGPGSTGNPHRDSTKTNTYPELLGGGDSKPKTLVDGAGLVDPSKNWQLANDGSLPDCAHLGCNENSKYLPSSRMPGDMDLIPDPYRVSQSYMNSSYSFKTEPTPFLTDFSAFLK
jgi:hypothetical protein